MDASRVDIIYRPLRVGWVLHSQDHGALRSAMRMSFCLIGGQHNPIILFDQPEAEALVRLFRVDMLEAISADSGAAEFVSRFPHLPRPIMGPIFDTTERRLFSSCQLVDVINGLHVYSDWSNWNDSSGPESGLQQFRWDDDDPLADIHLAEFGGFPANDLVGRDYASSIRGYLANKDLPQVRLDPARPLPDTLVSRHSAASFLTDHGLSWRYPRDRGWFFPGIYLGDGSQVTDIVNFWNIRAANTPIRFVDHTRLDRYSLLAPALARRHRSHLSGQPDPRRNPAIWTTDEALATSLADQVSPGGPINLCRINALSWNGGALSVPTMYMGEASALGVEAQSRVTFGLPERPYRADEFGQQHLIASVKIDDPSFGPDKKETFGLPFLPEHNQTFGRALGVMHDNLRVEPGRLGLVIQAGATDKSVKAVSLWELASTLFKGAGLNASLSNGGLIAQQLINQVGGFEGGRVFKIPGVRRLLRTHGANDSFTKHAALKLIGERDPDSGASFADHHGLYIEPRQTGTNLTSDMVFSYLVEKGVFRMGWDLRCPRCQLQAWTALDQLTQHHTCGYCGGDFDATRQLVDRTMTFRRSGLLGIQRDAQGAVPVALALQQLANNLGHLGNDAFFLPSIELVDDGGAFRCETDIFGVFPETYPDRPAVVIGECKDRDGQIDAEDVGKLGVLAQRLGASGLEVFVLFAKLGPFTEGEIALAKTLNGRWQHRVILLTNRELEPYHLYERHEEDQGGRLFGSRIQDLALNSERIFQSLRADPPNE